MYFFHRDIWNTFDMVFSTSPYPVNAATVAKPVVLLLYPRHRWSRVPAFTVSLHLFSIILLCVSVYNFWQKRRKEIIYTRVVHTKN